MKHSHKRNSGSSPNLQFHKPFWIFFLLFVFVMIIPSLIVIGGGSSFTHFQWIPNVTIQKQADSGALTSKSPLTIGWISGNEQAMQHLDEYKNLTVVSPELAMVDNQYNLHVTSNSSLTNTIEKQGKKLWARLSIQTDTKANVHAFLADPNKTQAVIKKIYQSALLNNWYGVNLDIEQVSPNDRNTFSEFVKSLSIELNKSSIILSIDLPPDSNGKNEKAPFDHQVLGKYCSYIIFMGYDQHWSTDPVPGPVTSLSWLKENLQEYIQTGIPPEKIILGLPAYTRVWQQDQQGHVVRDPAQPIQYVEKILEQNKRNLTWDPVLGEFFTSYTNNNFLYKIWLPNAKSLNMYLDLISEYHLAGSAVWNLNQIQSDYWNQIFDKGIAKR